MIPLIAEVDSINLMKQESVGLNESLIEVLTYMYVYIYVPYTQLYILSVGTPSIIYTAKLIIYPSVLRNKMKFSIFQMFYLLYQREGINSNVLHINSKVI